MRDYNFFSPYIETKKSHHSNKKVYVATIAFMLISALVLYGWNSYSILKISKEVAAIDSYLSSAETMQGVKQYREAKQRVKVLKDYQLIVDDISKTIDSGDRINTELLSKLSDTLPKAVELHILSIAGDGIQIQGKSTSRTDVAEYVYNLKATEAFDSVYVASINDEGQTADNYIFTLICKLGVGKLNEAE